MIDFTSLEPKWFTLLTMTADLQNQYSEHEAIVTTPTSVSVSEDLTEILKNGNPVGVDSEELKKRVRDFTSSVINFDSTLDGFDIGQSVTLFVKKRNWYGNLVDTLPTLSGGSEQVEKQERLNQVFSDGYDLIGSFQQQTNSVKNNLTTLANDLSQAGAKFLILEPFGGYLSDLRFNIVDALSDTYPNFPEISQDTSAGSFVLILRATRTSEEVTDFMSKFSAMISVLYTFFSSNSTDFSSLASQLVSMYKSPTESPLKDIFSDEISAALERDYLQELELSTTGSIQTINANITEINSQLQSQVQDGLESLGLGNLGSAINNSLKNFDGDPLKFLGDVGNQVIPDVKDTLLKMSPGTKVVSSVDAYNTYLVNSENGSGSIFYNGIQYFSGNTLVGVKGQSSFTTDTDVWLELISEASVEDFADILGGWGQQKNELIPETNKSKDVFNKDSYSVDSDLNAQELTNRWYSITSIEQLGGSAISGFLKSGLELVKNGFSAVEGGLSTIAATMEWADQIRVIGQQVNDMQGQILQEVANQLPKSLELIDADVLSVPLQEGGLHRLRYIHNEWLSEEAPGVPIYNDYSIYLPVIIVYNDGSVLTKLGEVFKDKP